MFRVFVIIAACFATAASAASFNLRVSVPTTCVAQPDSRQSDVFGLAMFCNSPRGGAVFVIGSLSGTPVTMSVDGRHFRLDPGERREVFASDQPFHQRLPVEVAGAGSSPVAVLFQAVPN